MDLETSKAKVEGNHQAHLGCLSDIHQKTRFNYHIRYALALLRAESYALEELIQSAYSQDQSLLMEVPLGLEKWEVICQPCHLYLQAQATSEYWEEAVKVEEVSVRYQDFGRHLHHHL